MRAEQILAQLRRVSPTGTGRWIASCPTAAHSFGDRSRGLSVCEAADRVLIYCHAGCSAQSIVEAMGLSLSDLYFEPLRGSGRRPMPMRIPPSDLLTILDHEITVAVLILDSVIQRRAVGESDLRRLCLTAARVGKARDMANRELMVPHAA